MIPGSSWGVSALPSYRLYRLDGAGKITTAEWIEAESDGDALEKARARCKIGGFELWDRNRRVGPGDARKSQS
jgi:hypothetical protein